MSPKPQGFKSIKCYLFLTLDPHGVSARALMHINLTLGVQAGRAALIWNMVSPHDIKARQHAQLWLLKFTPYRQSKPHGHSTNGHGKTHPEGEGQRLQNIYEHSTIYLSHVK